MSADVFGVIADQGTVGILHDLGVDTWVVDFGSPGATRSGGYVVGWR
ncbi:MAG: hypothetical protein WBZ15_08275 [Mycobacterium sp.]